MTTARLRELLREATQGDWEPAPWAPGTTVRARSGEDEWIVVDDCEPTDAALIVAMHAALPALLDVADAAAKVAELTVRDAPGSAMPELRAALAMLAQRKMGRGGGT